MATRKSVEDYLIDFSKEEGGGGRARYKKGTYLFKIVSAKPTVSSNVSTPGLEIVLQFQDTKYKGKKLTETLWATPKAFSRFRSLLEACGKKVPTKVNLTAIAKAVKGSTLYCELDDEKPREGYSPRTRVTFDGFIHEDDYDPEDAEADEDTEDEDLEVEEDDEEEEDEDEEDEDEEEEEDDADSFAEMDRAELKAYNKSHKLGVTVSKRMSDDDVREALRAAEAGDEDEEDEEEEDEPEPPKRKKKAPARKSRAKAKKPAADDEDDEELEELDLDDL